MRVRIKIFLSLIGLISASLLVSSTVRCFVTTLGLVWSVAFLSWQLSLLITHDIIRYTMNMISPYKKAVLITGCDTGFGNLSVKLLNKYGFKVYAGCLFPEKEDAQRLKQSVTHPEKLVIFKLDVTNDEDIEAMFDTVKNNLEDDEVLWGVVNNAGIARFGDAELGTFDYQYRKLFDINVFGVVKVTRKLLPLLRRSKGRIVNIASLAGRVTLPLNTPYSMTKASVIAFTDGLRYELEKFGIHTVSIEPSNFTTNFGSNRADIENDIFNGFSGEIKAAYGNGYLEAICKCADYVLPRISSNKLEIVSDDILNALVSIDTEPRYICSNIFIKYVVVPLTSLPQDIIHFVVDSVSRRDFAKFYKFNTCKP